MEAGTNVLDNLPTDGSMNVIVKTTLEKLRGLENEYYFFKYDETNRRYEFFANENDNVPYLTVSMDASGNLKEVTYYDSNNDSFNRRNTYTSTFGEYGDYVEA